MIGKTGKGVCKDGMKGLGVEKKYAVKMGKDAAEAGRREAEKKVKKGRTWCTGGRRRNETWEVGIKEKKWEEQDKNEQQEYGR